MNFIQKFFQNKKNASGIKFQRIYFLSLPSPTFASIPSATRWCVHVDAKQTPWVMFLLCENSMIASEVAEKWCVHCTYSQTHTHDKRKIDEQSKSKKWENV